MIDDHSEEKNMAGMGYGSDYDPSGNFPEPQRSAEGAASQQHRERLRDGQSNRALYVGGSDGGYAQMKSPQMIQQRPSLVGQVKALNETVDVLRETLSMLEGHLGPILGPARPQPAPNAPEAEDASELARSFGGALLQLRHLNDRFLDLGARLEI